MFILKQRRQHSLSYVLINCLIETYVISTQNNVHRKSKLYQVEYFID